MLRRRAQAVMARDVDAFMATVADDDPAFVRRQRRLFAAMARVPFESYELEARWDRLGDLGYIARRGHGREETSLPVVEERYRLRGAEAEVVEDVFYTFAHRGDRWVITADDDVEDFGFQSARHLWDFGRVEVATKGRFMLLGHPCGVDCTLRRTLSTLADEALARVSRYWTVEDDLVAVLIPETEKELALMLQADFDLDDFVAFAVSSVDTRRGYEFVGPRIVVNPAALAGRSSEDVLRILAHELLHVTTRPAAGPFLPIFVEEGFANFVGEDGERAAAATHAAVAAAGFDGRLPADYEFTSGGGDAIFRSYQEAHSAVAHFVSEHGLESFVQFYRRVGRSGFRPGTTRYHVDRALKATTGAGFRAFERDWASSIAGT